MPWWPTSPPSSTRPPKAPWKLCAPAPGPRTASGGPTFDGAQITAATDLVVDGLLLDFKSARRPLAEMSQRAAWQLTGYLLLDAADRYRVDTVGLYLTPLRGPRLLARRRLSRPAGRLPPQPHRAARRVRRTARRMPRPGRRPVLRHAGRDRARPAAAERLVPAARPGCCPVCPQALPDSSRRPRKFCTTWCRDREKDSGAVAVRDHPRVRSEREPGGASGHGVR